MLQITSVADSPVKESRYFIWLALATLLSQHTFPSEKVLLAGRLLTTVLAMCKQVSFMQENKRAQGSTDMSYQIRVEGHLDLSWQEWFEGLELRYEEAGTTLLIGVLPDQAALQGVLLKISRLGLTLLSLESSKLA